MPQGSIVPKKGQLSFLRFFLSQLYGLSRMQSGGQMRIIAFIEDHNALDRIISVS